MIKINNPGNAMRMLGQMSAVAVAREETTAIMEELNVIASKLIINEKILTDSLSGPGYKSEEAKQLLKQLQESREMLQAILAAYE